MDRTSQSIAAEEGRVYGEIYCLPINEPLHAGVIPNNACSLINFYDPHAGIPEFESSSWAFNFRDALLGRIANWNFASEELQFMTFPYAALLQKIKLIRDEILQSQPLYVAFEQRSLFRSFPEIGDNIRIIVPLTAKTKCTTILSSMNIPYLSRDHLEAQFSSFYFPRHSKVATDYIRAQLSETPSAPIDSISIPKFATTTDIHQILETNPIVQKAQFLPHVITHLLNRIIQVRKAVSENCPVYLAIDGDSTTRRSIDPHSDIGNNVRILVPKGLAGPCYFLERDEIIETRLPCKPIPAGCDVSKLSFAELCQYTVKPLKIWTDEEKKCWHYYQINHTRQTEIRERASKLYNEETFWVDCFSLEPNIVADPTIAEQIKSPSSTVVVDSTKAEQIKSLPSAEPTKSSIKSNFQKFIESVCVLFQSFWNRMISLFHRSSHSK